MKGDQDDDDLQHACFQIALTVRQAPLFAIAEVCDWFQEVAESELWVSVLLDSMIGAFAHVEALGSGIIHFGPDENRQEKLKRLLPLAEILRSRYADSGPWDTS